MHYYISSIISFFLNPLVWIISLIILSLLTKSSNLKKKFLVWALCIFLVFSNLWLITAYARWWQPKQYDEKDQTKYSCALLLGGFASPDYNEKGYFNGASDRFIQAVRQYKMGKVKYILVNGGNGKVMVENFNEGEWTKSELSIMGVPDSAILYEDQSTNTAQNAMNAKKIMDSAKLKPPYLLITSAHHIPRATLLFSKAGIQTTPLPCSYVAGNEAYTFTGIIPQPDVLMRWGFYFKEAFAYVVYRIKN